MLAIGVPITFALVFLRCYLLLLPYHPMPPFLDFAKDDCGAGWLYAISHSLLVLAGNIMNTGGIARRLVNLRKH